MSITHIYRWYRNPETQKKTRFLSSGTKLFYYLWVKRFFDIRKRDTIFLCWLFHLLPTPCAAPDARPMRASESHPFSSDGKTQRTDFSQISAHASGAWRHSHPWSYPLSGIFIVTYLNGTSAPHAREHLHPCLDLTNPCTEPRSSQPN